ncbi:alginate export family protein [Phenylobacterium montanum]|uniref:Alginate export family protein n=1 Tax=Phenylobacterium montanum TaxID=2823693 RepID=A0A975G2M4_9CAUL|nr:alginate export family protein [Caulobacter sp. S6]QUD89571.1 alginate export family protein [Caulobacter sp. S6]
MKSALLALSLFAASWDCAWASEAPAPSSPFRYDDDLSLYRNGHQDDLFHQLKALPLGEDAILSLGADLRERVETSNATLLGLRYRGRQTYDLHRLQVYGDLRLEPDVRVFVQLGNYEEIGRKPGPIPTDVDRLDLSQAFVDIGRDVAGGHAALRLGRAEMSFDEGALIGLRDGPNVRQVWDGARLTYVVGPWRWDAFAVRPDAVKPGDFNDHALAGQSLEGVHLTLARRGPWAVDAFYYHVRNPLVSILGAAGPERTDTLGARLRGGAGALSGSVGLIGQTGSAAGRPVRAFAAHGDVGWRFDDVWTPNLSVRADVLSGGDNSRHVTTFNALYPNVAYSTEATIEAPANLIETGLVAEASPIRPVTLQYTLEGLWRFSVKDAFYAAPFAPLVRPNGAGDRYSGIEQQVKCAWRINAVATLTAALAHFSAGAFIRHAGGRDEDFAMTSLSLRF